MTEKQAIRKAREKAKTLNETVYVVYEKDMHDLPGNDYHVATEEDMDTFWAGVAAIHGIEG